MGSGATDRIAEAQLSKEIETLCVHLRELGYAIRSIGPLTQLSRGEPRREGHGLARSVTIGDHWGYFDLMRLVEDIRNT